MEDCVNKALVKLRDCSGHLATTIYERKMIIP